jgi:hypothetical protein
MYKLNFFILFFHLPASNGKVTLVNHWWTSKEQIWYLPYALQNWLSIHHHVFSDLLVWHTWECLHVLCLHVYLFVHVCFVLYICLCVHVHMYVCVCVCIIIADNWYSVSNWLSVERALLHLLSVVGDRQGGAVHRVLWISRSGEPDFVSNQSYTHHSHLCKITTFKFSQIPSHWGFCSMSYHFMFATLNHFIPAALSLLMTAFIYAHVSTRSISYHQLMNTFFFL